MKVAGGLALKPSQAFSADEVLEVVCPGGECSDGGLHRSCTAARGQSRDLRNAQLPEQDFDRIVLDVSFISLRLVLPVVWPLLRPRGQLSR